MKYTEVLYLIQKELITDNIGNRYYKNAEDRQKVYANMQKVGSNEFSNASSYGIKLSYEVRSKLSN